MTKQSVSEKRKLIFQVAPCAVLLAFTISCGLAQDKKTSNLEKKLEELNAELEDERAEKRKLEDMQPPAPPAKDQDAVKQEEAPPAPKEEAAVMAAIPDKVPAEFKEAATQCLKIWGKDAAFTKDSPVRVLKPEAAGPGPSITDPDASEKPTLVLVPAAPAGPGNRYELLDPMGWYCVSSAPQGGGRINVDLKKGARLIDTAGTIKIDEKAETGNVSGTPGAVINVRVVD